MSIRVERLQAGRGAGLQARSRPLARLQAVYGLRRACGRLRRDMATWTRARKKVLTAALRLGYDPRTMLVATATATAAATERVNTMEITDAQRNATANFHDRMARAFAQFGNKRDAEAARKAAKLAREATSAQGE